MIRTQVYLSEEQKISLSSLAVCKGENISQLIREAIESYITQQQKIKSSRKQTREQIFHKAFGMWKDNTTNFTAIRQSADRF
jgi:hypothetical protein